MSETIPRRDFLKRSAVAGAVAVSLGRSRSVLGANERVRLGVIGTGGRARGLMRTLLNIPNNEMIAVCDVYEPRRLEAAAIPKPAAEQFTDYRALLDRKDVDAVVIGSPDHWHMKMVMDAVRAGKDVYLEKPITHSLEEGPQIIRAVQESKRVVQTGTQQRSWEHYKLGREIIASGKLGKITLTHAFWYQNYATPRRRRPEVDQSKLDWKAWLGSAPAQPFDLNRFTTWRWYWDFGGGALTDLFTHWVDVIHWYMSQNAPLTASATGSNHYFKHWDCPDTITAAFEYPGDFTVMYNGTMTSSVDYGGIEFRGEKGTLKIDRQRLAVYSEAEPRSDTSASLPEPEILVRSTGDGTGSHLENFLACVRSRQNPAADVRVGFAASRASHLGNVSLRRGARIRFDAATGKIT